MLRRNRFRRANNLPAFVPAVWCAGLNFKSHAEEVSLPIPSAPTVWTMKSTSALLYPPPPTTPAAAAAAIDNNNEFFFCGEIGSQIRIPKLLQQKPEVDYEGEIAIIIGGERDGWHGLSRQDVVDGYDRIVQGYACAMDITARRWQGKKGGGQWVVAKSFPTFLPLGPAVTPIPLDVLPTLAMSTMLNGERVQHEFFSNMIFDVPTLIAQLSAVTRLRPGTVVLSGTPSGVGYARKPEPRYLRDGDELEVIIDRVGSLKCSVVF